MGWQQTSLNRPKI